MDKMIFISHNSADKNIAREIGIFLTSEDLNVWFDEWEIPYGESIPAQVEIGLSACSHLVLIWSKDAANSPWVERELYSVLHKALSNKNSNVVIIPVCLDDTPLPTIVADKLTVKYIKGDENDRYTIIKAVTGDAPSKNYIEAIVKKYNEVIFDYDTDDIFSLRACPSCGKTDLEQKSYTDYEHDEVYFIISCRNCGWSDWTQ